MELKRLAILLLLALPIAAQQKVPGWYDPRAEMDKFHATMQGHYGAFTITTIPKSCKHTWKLFDATVCRVWVKYPRGFVEKPIFFIEDWTDPNESDHSHSNDTIYHVALINPTQRGVYIEGRPGHRIWWQVNNP